MNKTELNLILQEGEGQFIEFKENLDKKFAKEIIAFANASGGRVFLGITDEGKVNGIKITNDLKSRITDIAKNCDPFMELSIKEGKIRFDEQICKDFVFEDFDDSKFEYYLKLARISYTLDRKSMLGNLKVLKDNEMTNAGVLFFAKNPSKYISTSKIRCVLFRGNKRVDILDRKEVDKGIIGNIEFAVNFLSEHIPVRFEIKEI